ncbi:hypothetical protein AK830_g114 [Neonectria ditissima]|uniref:Oxidoreductase acuF-like C2H2 type zinc-finger domain-containing protein n=1 Tax=Neonectria ditissima TaxID=78410 RepID=A0A0P7BHP0_9HYPO|nr:hypothetical protein AK830_g114 [Neonectria ditissima]
MRDSETELLLDYQLPVADDLRQEITRQLDETIAALDDLTSVIAGTNPGNNTMFGMGIKVEDSLFADDDSLELMARDPLAEASVLIDIISQCIRSLLRLGTLVRKSTSGDEFKQALQASELSFPSSLDIGHVRQAYPKIKDISLLHRLGYGISKRRQFIAYYRDQVARFWVEDMEDRRDNVSMHVGQLSGFTGSMPSDTKEADDGIPLKSASTTAESFTESKLPTLANLTKDSQPFECPICFTIQSFITEQAWRIHAFRDLKAYMCTVSEPNCDTKLFGDRDAWFEHEMQNHRFRYRCRLCRHGPLGSEDMRSHIQLSHGPFPNDQLKELQDAGKEALTQVRALDCPFCEDWVDASPNSEQLTQETFVSASQFKRHVAMHQEQLAIFSFSRATEKTNYSDPTSVISSPLKNYEPGPTETEAAGPTVDKLASDERAGGKLAGRKQQYMWECHMCHFDGVIS